MKRVFIIHGWGGYPQEGWRPWLKSQLEKHALEVVIPKMPDKDHPIARKWVQHLSKIIRNPSTNDFLVGHSLGCITILRYLETLEDKQNIGGAVFVAGFAKKPIFEGDMSSFLNRPINWQKIKSHCPKFIAIHSDNDPYVPLSYADDFNNNLAAKIIIEHNMLHFSGDDNPPCLQLPSALNALLEISSKILRNL